MTELLESLAALLAAECELYARLCDALRGEREALAARDVPALERLVREKEEISDEGRLLEESRAVVAESLARAVRLETPRPRLSQLCDALGADAEPLRDAHRRLGALLALARELIEANGAATARELSNVQASLRALGAMPAPLGYADIARGCEAGRLLSEAV
jgi:hypothetical protein